jgi:tranposase-like protein
MGYLKGKSALIIFDKHANLKYKFGNRNFWSEGYYISTIGLNLFVVWHIINIRLYNVLFVVKEGLYGILIYKTNI